MDAKTVITALQAEIMPKEISSTPNNFVSLLNSLLDAAKITAHAVLGGSYAKNTYLEGDHDIDIFVRFDKKYTDKEMPDLLSLALGGLGGLKRIHGSRDYFQLEKDGFFFEIVPVLHITDSSEARNVTDASPLHVAHVKEAIIKNPVLATDIRIAKLFCKAAKVYGAESYLNGFSGHVLDNLVMYYGSFLSLIEAASTWPDFVFIDPSGKHDSPDFLNAAKREGPLILLDPIQPERNAAAALAKDKFDLFRHAAEDFLDNPSDDFFRYVPLDKEYVYLLHGDKNIFCYVLSALEGSKDVIGTKLFKAQEYFIKQAKKEGFSVIDSGFEFFGKEAFCFLVVEEQKLTPTKEQMGPPLTAKADVQKFRDAHVSHDIFEREERLFAIVPRTHLTLDSLFVACKNSLYWRERVLQAKVI